MKNLIKVLFFCFLCQFIPNYAVSQNAISNSYKHLEGSLNANYPVTMDIVINKYRVDGYYYYDKFGEPISLSGEIDSTGKFKLTEGTDGAAVFTGKLIGKKMDGIWKGQNNKKLTFSLVEKYADNNKQLLLKTRNATYAFTDSSGAPFAKINQSLLLFMNNETDNKEINKIILNNFFQKSDQSAEILLDNEVKRFFVDYKSTISDYDAEMSDLQSWTFDRGMEVLYNKNGLMSFEISYYEYSGGAHGSYGSKYFVIDVENGRELKFDDVILTSAKTKVSELISESLKKTLKLDPDASLQENGFYEEEIEPNENFFITNKGIAIHYNSYEIAPYVMGPFTIFISFKQLEGAVKLKM